MSKSLEIQLQIARQNVVTLADTLAIREEYIATQNAKIEHMAEKMRDVETGNFSMANTISNLKDEISELKKQLDKNAKLEEKPTKRKK